MHRALTLSRSLNLPVFLNWTRWALLGGLLIVEWVLLSMRFDTKTLTSNFRGWEGTLRELHHLPQLAIAVIIGAVVFGGSRWIADTKNQLQRDRSCSWPWWYFLLSHVGAFAVFVWLSTEVFEGSAGRSQAPIAWLFGWGFAGLATVVFWLGALLPFAAWRVLVTRGLGSLMIGLGVGLAAVVAGRVTADLWNPLGRWTLAAVQMVLSLPYGDVLQCDLSRSRLATNQFWVEVAPECSGYEGIGLIWVFLLFFMCYFRRELRFPNALLLLPLGTVVIWFANVLRISALFIIGQHRPDIALAGFHSQAGWIAFNVVAFGLIAASRRMPFFAKSVDDNCERATNHATIAYLAPLLAILAGTMITQAMSDGFDTLYPIRIVVAALLLWWFRNVYDTQGWSWSLTPVALGVAVYAIWICLEAGISHTVGVSPWSPDVNLDQAGTIVWISVRIIGSVLIIPVVEELAFRGYLLRRLVSADFQSIDPRTFSWFSFLASSALFGALHSRWLAGTVAGMLFAIALYRRGRLVDAVVAHAVANALIALHVLLTGQWSLWV